ncbi:MAG TPA: 50S ribosomal protein L29 [Candidatus Babeliales bacterium]|jgi:ribosomal protein L29|nr:50S ribosomal protein L29 [Candidatus Babeliales bacterium]
MNKAQLKFLQSQQLCEKVDEARRELFSFRLNAATMHNKDYSQFKKKRKLIARLLTYIVQKDITR